VGSARAGSADRSTAISHGATGVGCFLPSLAVTAVATVEALEQRSLRQEFPDYFLPPGVGRETFNAQAHPERELGCLRACLAHPWQELQLGPAYGKATVGGEGPVAQDWLRQQEQEPLRREEVDHHIPLRDFQSPANRFLDRVPGDTVPRVFADGDSDETAGVVGPAYPAKARRMHQPSHNNVESLLNLMFRKTNKGGTRTSIGSLSGSSSISNSSGPGGDDLHLWPQ
jgi:hypothetical protein